MPEKLLLQRVEKVGLGMLKTRPNPTPAIACASLLAQVWWPIQFSPCGPLNVELCPKYASRSMR